MTARPARTGRPEPLTAEQVRAFRLRRHHLLERAPRASLVEAVGNVCGIQAQVASAAGLSLRARVEDLSPEDVERALWRERSLVRTWCLRSTVHLAAAADLPMLAGALGARAQRDRERWAAARGLAAADVAAVVRESVDSLDGEPATYADLRERMAAGLPRRAARACDETALTQLVQTACVEGLLVSGPPAGARVTFVRPERWIRGGSGRMPERAAQDALLRRYLGAYGPATLQDFAGWTGLAVRDARPVWERLAAAGEIADVAVEGKAARMLREDLPAVRAASLPERHVRLLPAFDVLLLAHQDKALLVGAAHRGRIFREAARVSPVLLVDGAAAGIWSAGSAGGVLRVTVEPFQAIARGVRARIEAEAADVGRFLGVRAEVRLGKIASPSFVV